MSFNKIRICSLKKKKKSLIFFFEIYYIFCIIEKDNYSLLQYKSVKYLLFISIILIKIKIIVMEIS